LWCACCNKQVLLCSACDRGNQYCFTCAHLARRKAQALAGRRCQRSSQGRRKHAARQMRYRQRQKQIVTHQAPPEPQEPLDCDQMAEAGLAVASASAEPPAPAPSGDVREPDVPTTLLCTSEAPRPAPSPQASVSTSSLDYQCARCGCRVGDHFRRDFVRRRRVASQRRGSPRLPGRQSHAPPPRHF
jgi:hypothetical protein